MDSQEQTALAIGRSVSATCKLHIRPRREAVGELTKIIATWPSDKPLRVMFQDEARLDGSAAASTLG